MKRINKSFMSTYINWNNIPSGRNYDMPLFVGQVFGENWDMYWWLFL
jgi:hypothetical protein